MEKMGSRSSNHRAGTHVVLLQSIVAGFAAPYIFSVCISDSGFSERCGQAEQGSVEFAHASNVASCHLRLL